MARMPDGKWIKGTGSPNPGGKLKRVLEAREVALEETPASFRLLVAQRDDTGEDSRVRQAAAKLLIAYGIGEPPKVIEIDNDASGGDVMDKLTVEEVRELARQSLADDTPEMDDAGDDDADEIPH